LRSCLQQAFGEHDLDDVGDRLVEIDVPVNRLPAPVEATAYFVVAEL
jgi:hypothetical protein